MGSPGLTKVDPNATLQRAGLVRCQDRWQIRVSDNELPPRVIEAKKRKRLASDGLRACLGYGIKAGRSQSECLLPKPADEWTSRVHSDLLENLG